MKRFLMIISLLTAVSAASAQSGRDESERGFKKENLFTGGSLDLGFGSGTFNLGVEPYFGYSLNKYIDVAASVNYNYISQRDYLQLGDKLRQHIVGAGIFTRIFPVHFAYAHAEFQENFITLKYMPADNGYYASYKATKSVPSVLLGPGLATGRDEDNKTYGYISVLFDVAKNKNSPYVDQLGRTIPVFRAGVNIALFQGRSTKGRRMGGRNRD